MHLLHFQWYSIKIKFYHDITFFSAYYNATSGACPSVLGGHPWNLNLSKDVTDN